MASAEIAEADGTDGGAELVAEEPGPVAPGPIVDRTVSGASPAPQLAAQTTTDIAAARILAWNLEA